MDPPVISRQRLVRDYSDEDTTIPPRTLSLPHRDTWLRSKRSDNNIIFEEADHPDEASTAQKQDFSLSPINESSSYARSVSTQPTSVSVHSTTRLADFFSPDVLNIVLHNPTTAHQLRKFAHSRLCGENLDFLDKVDQYHLALNQVTKTLFDIHRCHISSTSEAQVNLPEHVLIQINKNLKQLLSRTMPNMESVFVAAQHDIEQLVASDIYPRFVRHQMTMSATRALATNTTRYAGLGDSFVLTNPNKADNPIVYASDGFVKVSGYKRNEIIPRNCRFLQTAQTERESVKRIKDSVINPAECVELLLNERKNGEPFWNLLYTAPLYHPNGRLAFFLGGQINVSSTVHNTSDILRILSYNCDDDESEAAQEPQSQPAPITKSYRQSFMNTLRRQKTTRSRTPGMETDLLDDLNRLSFRQQKDTFYTAYSKYIVVDTDTMLIAFHSAGAMEIFSITRGYNTTSQPHSRERAQGQDVFKFLGQHSPGGLARDYKSRVKAALKSGMAITLEIALNTRRNLDSERFASHWTPLKNEFNAMGFAILTLSSDHDRTGRGR